MVSPGITAGIWRCYNDRYSVVSDRGLALALLVSRVFANDHDIAVAADDLALFTNLLNAGLDLHGVSLCSLSSYRQVSAGRYFPAMSVLARYL